MVLVAYYIPSSPFQAARSPFSKNISYFADEKDVRWFGTAFRLDVDHQLHYTETRELAPRRIQPSPLMLHRLDDDVQ